MTDSDGPFTPEDRELMRRARRAWGEDMQYLKAVEEAGELQSELPRLLYGRADEEDVVDEVADVAVMMEQLRVCLGEERVDRRIREKMERLEGRVEAAEEDG